MNSEDFQSGKDSYAPILHSHLTKIRQPVDPNSVDIGCDPKTLSIADALAFQEQKQFPLETFCDYIVAKMNFNVDQFYQLKTMIHSTDTVSKLFACIGMRKLLPIKLV